MKPATSFIAFGGLLVLALAGYFVYRTYQQNEPVPAPQAATSTSDPRQLFAPCAKIAETGKRALCEVKIARERGETRCIDGRLYHVYRDTGGSEQFDPWPEGMRCWQ